MSKNNLNTKDTDQPSTDVLDLNHQPADHSRVKAFSLWDFLLLTPSQNLLTRPLRYWLYAVRTVIFLTASVEAIAWGYIGFLFIGGMIGWVVGLAVLMGIFALVYVIDATMAVSDLGSTFYTKKCQKTVPSNSNPIQPTQSWFKEHKVFALALALRVIMAVISLTITAPFISQLVSNRDVLEYLHQQQTQSIAEKRAAIETKHQSVIDGIQNDISRLQVLKQAEVAGQKTSATFVIGGREQVIQTTGKPTKGYVTKMMEQLQQEFQDRLNKAQEEKKTELTKFDQFVQTNQFDQLRQQWGVEVKGDTLDNRFEALSVISSRPSHGIVSRTIKVLLCLIFFALLILKLFQSAAARLYYSEYAQGMWLDYENKNFDHWLPVQLRSTGNKMSPTRFEQFLLDDYPDWYRLEFQKRADRLYQGEIEEVESTVSGHLNIALSKYEKAQTDLQSVEETLAGSLAEIEAQQETVRELEQQRKELYARETELEQWVTASEGVTPASVKIKMRFATGLENQIEAVESALKIEKDRLNAMERQQRLTMRRLEQLKDEVDQ
ncbi:MAG TPA: DUF4407 domain-containing protein, partial [Acidobacteriota bacterium]|nr:DUF4407 domain-containing protein [Acidobacteriota bacterium]